MAIKLFKKLVLFLSMIVVIMTINTHYHFHIEHHEDHQHVHIDVHKVYGEHSSFHDVKVIDCQNSICIVGSILLLLVLLKNKNLFFFIAFRVKTTQLVSKITSYRYIFVDPHSALLRSILLHAPPR